MLATAPFAGEGVGKPAPPTAFLRNFSLKRGSCAMSNSDTEHYLFVIKDLSKELEAIRTDREELDRKESALKETLAFMQAKVKSIRPASAPSKRPPRSGVDHPYRGMSLVGAAELALENAGEWQDTRALTDAILAGGYRTKSKDFYNNVYGTLYAASRQEDPRIIKSGNKWGLKGWPEPLSEAVLAAPM